MSRFLWLLMLLLPLHASAQQTNSRVVTSAQLPHDSGGVSFADANSGFTMPRGTTQQRPAAPSEGGWRFNTTLNCPEQFAALAINNGNAGWRCGGGTWSPPGISSATGTSTTSATLVTLGNATIPGGVMGRVGCLTVSFTYTFTGNTNAKAWTVILGPSPNTIAAVAGTATLFDSNTSSNTVLSTSQVRKICNSNATNVQDIFTSATQVASTGIGAVIAASAVDTTGTTYLSFNCSVAGGSTCTLKHWEYSFSAL